MQGARISIANLCAPPAAAAGAPPFVPLFDGEETSPCPSIGMSPSPTRHPIAPANAADAAPRHAARRLDMQFAVQGAPLFGASPLQLCTGAAAPLRHSSSGAALAAAGVAPLTPKGPHVRVAAAANAAAPTPSQRQARALLQRAIAAKPLAELDQAQQTGAGGCCGDSASPRDGAVRPHSAQENAEAVGNAPARPGAAQDGELRKVDLFRSPAAATPRAVGCAAAQSPTSAVCAARDFVERTDPAGSAGPVEAQLWACMVGLAGQFENERGPAAGSGGQITPARAVALARGSDTLLGIGALDALHAAAQGGTALQAPNVQRAGAEGVGAGASPMRRLPVLRSAPLSSPRG